MKKMLCVFLLFLLLLLASCAPVPYHSVDVSPPFTEGEVVAKYIQEERVIVFHEPYFDVILGIPRDRLSRFIDDEDWLIEISRKDEQAIVYVTKEVYDNLEVGEFCNLADQALLEDKHKRIE